MEIKEPSIYPLVLYSDYVTFPSHYEISYMVIITETMFVLGKQTYTLQFNKGSWTQGFQGQNGKLLIEVRHRDNGLYVVYI